MTERLYWADGNLYECMSVVKSVCEKEEGKMEVVFEKTIFHPQGGGQPSDVGMIRKQSKDQKDVTQYDWMSVEKAVIKGDEIVHLVNKEFEIVEGDDILMKLDAGKRDLNTKLHSAGHLLDVAMFSLVKSNIQPGKGYHFPDAPYVEYVGKLTIEEKKDLPSQLGDEMARLINKGGKVVKEMVDWGKLEQVLGEKPPGFLPKDQPARVVTFPGLKPYLCGGTHVDDLHHIPMTKIRKIAGRGARTRVAYYLAE